MSDLVQFTEQDGIAVITINNPPVNALSPGVPEGIREAIGALYQDASLKAGVLIGGGRTFVAGADIKEFAKVRSGEKKRGNNFLDLLLEIEDSPKPIVMAIHGNALGGGLELAMAGHYRVATPSAQVGQPEVKLGIIPGAAGTQRLPRLAGVAKAVEMCVEGKPISAQDALQSGIIDRIIDGDLLAGAVSFAREIESKPAPKTRERSEKLGTPATNEPIFAAARQNAIKKQRGLLAPIAAIDAIEAATRLSFTEGLRVEQSLFANCLFSDQSKGLIHAFFGEREVGKIPGIAKETPILPVNSIAVVGAGTMGGGIAMAFANAGIPVLLKEVEAAALERGMANIRKNYQNSVTRGRFKQHFVDERLKLITPSTRFDGFSKVDMVVEAVFENLALKKEVFRELDRVCRPGAILATNSSSLSIDEIADVTQRPEFVIGTHFFSPANIMKLLEVVRGKATSNEVIATCMQLGKKIGKVAVLAGNCPGFIGNRMFGPYRREAQFLVEEGASVQAVDDALVQFGMAMGPLATGDLAGLDIGWLVRKENPFLLKSGGRVAFVEDRLCELGRFGQKTGRGWYKYDENRRPSNDPEVAALIHQWTSEAGIPQREVAAGEIVERCIYSLINEGAKILEEGFALRPTDIDVIYLNGYGFPSYRGGPMWYADTVGVKKVYDRICEFRTTHGVNWEPAPLLQKLAEEGKTFANLESQRGATA